MSKETKEILAEKGNEKVRIRIYNRKITGSKYFIEFATTRNGWSWNCIDIDDEMLILINTAIEEYLKNKGDTSI